MPQGLQVWDAAGTKTLDTTQQTSSILGSINVTQTGTTTITDSRLNWGTPFFLADAVYAGTEIKAVFTGAELKLTITNNTGGLAPLKPVTVFYGVF